VLVARPSTVDGSWRWLPRRLQWPGTSTSTPRSGRWTGTALECFLPLTSTRCVCVRVCACVRVCVCVMPARLSVFQALPHVRLSAIRSMVAAVDGDGDGCISATEFARLVRGDGMDGAADSAPACSSCSSGRDGLQPSESCGRGLSPHTAAHTAAPMPHSSLCVGETRCQCQCQCRSQCQRHCQCGSDSAAGSDSDVRDVGAGHSSEAHDRDSIVSAHRDKRVCTRRSVSPAHSACGKH
jgi:hypothetical protein